MKGGRIHGTGQARHLSECTATGKRHGVVAIAAVHL
jgi:hypothetical protein